MSRNRMMGAAALGVLACASPGLGQAQTEELEILTVTGTREAESLVQTPASVGVVQEDAVRFAAPSHPQQIMSQVPGVAVGVTNGEGHTTAIRQPFTTSPVYLFLEDGIPTRATGFFNHNALYELNVPAASTIEVVRGPGTALYGSDAIGGIVNVITRPPAPDRGAEASLEAGSHGWYRLLATGDSGFGRLGGLRADVNISHTDGWRDATDYDRLSAGLRWDHAPSDRATFQTVLGVTKIDQQTGANSPLPWEAYRNRPKENLFAIAYREVEALRLSSRYDLDLGSNAELSLTPYVRRNVMELNASFLLAFDPTIARSEVWSWGVLAKWRKDFPAWMQARLIVGVDIDYSPGSRREDSLVLETSGSGAARRYEGYTVGERIYDYDVDYQSVSPYVHGEISPLPRMRLTGGLRYDDIRYRMKNQLGAGPVAAAAPFGPRSHHQVADARADFSHWSPKLGMTYALHPSAHLYVSHTHGFRAPSESQLFRAGGETDPIDAEARAQGALLLKPIRANQTEVGLRGQVAGWRYDAVAYLLRKRDDLVSQRDLETNATVTLNAGRTEHRGVELGLGRRFGPWRLDAALSRARHRYVDWVTAAADYSGREMEAAPRWLANTRLGWEPVPGTRAQLEWVRIGSWWLEASNSEAFGKYGGHDLFHLRVAQRVSDRVELFGRVMNLTDRRYADSASVSSNTPVYSPGLPRTWYGGLEVQW